MSEIFLIIFIITAGFSLLDYSTRPTDMENLQITQTEPKPVISRPKFWFYTELNTRHMFELMEKILLKLDLEKIEMDTNEMHYNWDFLWAFEYLTNIPINYSALEFHQKINHVPGIAQITSKAFLATYTHSKYIPKGFRTKQDLIKYANQNPKTRFVQKLTTNRGVALKTVSEINIGRLEGPLESFAQVFVENPLLIGGHKFDFNIFVVIASVDPLRIYYYEQNTHFRFCPRPYDSQNFTDPGTYIVDDSHIQGSDFPEMNKYFRNSYTLKEAFDEIMKEKGYKDTKVIYNQVEDCIRGVIHANEKFYISEIARYKAAYGKFHFVDLVRFDFLIDNDLNLHLMEVNLSPNLHAIGKNADCKNLFQSVIYNYLNLIGVGTYLNKNHINVFKEDEEEFVCHDSSITVNAEACLGSQCKESCSLEICKLCLHCMDNRLKYDLKVAYLENVNIGGMKRIFPPENEMMDENFLKGLSESNKIMAIWFREMCKKNRRFC